MLKQEIEKEDTIDLIELLTKVWNGRKIVLRTLVLFFIIGVFVAFLTPNSFEASSVFISQSSDEKPSSSIGGLASLAGINLGNLGNSSGISTAVYPQIIYSVPFKRAMLEANILYEDRSVTYKEYLIERPIPLSERIRMYTIGLPSLVIDWISSDAMDEGSFEDTEYALKISEEEFELMDNFEKNISLSVNEEEGYITLAFTDYIPEIAAQMASLAERELQDRIIDYQVKKNKHLYDFTKTQFLELQAEVFNLQDRIAKYSEENQNISSPIVRNQLRRMESEYDRINTVYSEMALQKEQAAIQLEKNTPIFSIINPVRIPNKKSGPNRILIIGILSFLGFILSAIFIAIKDPIRNFVLDIKGK